MSAETCIPVDWGRLISPYLHLTLGLVNDKVQRIYKELLALDGIDEEAAQRLSDLTVVAAEVRSKTNSSTKLKEYSTFSLLAILLLQVPLGSTPNMGKCVEDKPFGTWGFLADEAKSEAAASSAAGAALAARTLNGNNQKLSTR